MCTCWQQYHGTIPLLSAPLANSLFASFSIPFHLLGNPPWRDRIPSTLVPGCSWTDFPFLSPSPSPPHSKFPASLLRFPQHPRQQRRRLDSGFQGPEQFPPFWKWYFSPSCDMSFFNSYHGLIALILPFLHFVSPFLFFFPLSFFFLYIFPLFSSTFHIFSPQVTSADIFPLPRGGGGVYSNICALWCAL